MFASLKRRKAINGNIRELQHCAAQQTGDWITAAGVSMAHLLMQERLPIDVLDEAFPNNPVMVLDNLGHGVWVNTSALQAVGYDTLEGNPQGGIIVRDPNTNQLTGVLLENAQQAIRSAAFPPNDINLDRAYDGLLLSLEILAENGITTVSDAGGYWTRGHERVWAWAEEAGDLTVRAINALYLFPDIPYDEQIEALRSRLTNDPNALVRFNQVKIYVDGILSQGTGALLEPYNQTFGLHGVPNDGFLYFDIETLNRYTTELDAMGFQLHIHVTGDRGARIALDTIEHAQQINGTVDNHHRITHLFLVDETDRHRFAQLGVYADFQLAPSSVDDANIDYMFNYIGERAEQLLPAFELIAADAPVVISSDWDADELSPFAKIQTIINIDFDNELSLDQILRMMTIDVARLLHHENQTGSLEVGKYADMIVLDQNLFEVNPSLIADTSVLLTFFNGEVIYEQ